MCFLHLFIIINQFADIVCVRNFIDKTYIYVYLFILQKIYTTYKENII